MQHLEDDMDELFRKAADEYPLKTDGADWENIAEKLIDADAVPLSETKSVTGNKKQRLWLLLLLILFAFICSRYMTGIGNKDLSLQPAKKIQPAQQPVTKSLPQIIPSDIAGNKILNEKNHLVVTEKKAFENNLLKNIEATDSKKLITDNNKTSAVINNENLQTNINDQDVNSGSEKKSPVANSSSNTNNKIQSTDNSPADKTTATADALNSASAKNITVATVADTSSNHNIIKKNNDNKKDHQTHFYAGLFAGPDITTVKLQSVKGIGYSLGLLIGYRFHQHFAIETGLLWDKKKYYTEGKYFDTKKINIPDYVQIIDMNGNCSMFEIPVNFRYDFVQNKKRKLFATTGISSYIMKKENYNYLADAYGQQYSLDNSYNNSARNWFSVLHVSIGYEKSLGKIGNLRIEPYFKIPLKGVGIGSLPISSTGLYIGITRNIP